MIKTRNPLRKLLVACQGGATRVSSLAAVALMMGSAAMMGCSDGIASPPLMSTDPYTVLRMNTNAATMSTVAPYNVLQLTATPYTAFGKPVSNAPQAVYQTYDTTIVISPSGKVTALYATAPGVPATIAVSLQDSASNVTQVDTVYITVTDTTPTTPLASVSIIRQPGDTAPLGLFTTIVGVPYGYPVDTLRVAVTGEDGTDLKPNVSLRFRSSDISVATVDPVNGLVKGVQKGRVTIHVATTYYGVTKSDSFRLRISDPQLVMIRVSPIVSPTTAGKYLRVFTPNTITISAGGTVLFYAGLASTPSPTPLSWDVIFDTPDEVQPSPIPISIFYKPRRGTPIFGRSTGPGNIETTPAPYSADGSVENPECSFLAACVNATRSFPRPGTYHYHSALYGSTGKIVVTP